VSKGCSCDPIRSKAFHVFVSLLAALLLLPGLQTLARADSVSSPFFPLRSEVTDLSTAAGGAVAISPSAPKFSPAPDDHFCGISIEYLLPHVTEEKSKLEQIFLRETEAIRAGNYSIGGVHLPCKEGVTDLKVELLSTEKGVTNLALLRSQIINAQQNWVLDLAKLGELKHDSLVMIRVSELPRGETTEAILVVDNIAEYTGYEQSPLHSAEIPEANDPLSLLNALNIGCLERGTFELRVSGAIVADISCRPITRDWFWAEMDWRHLFPFEEDLYVAPKEIFNVDVVFTDRVGNRSTPLTREVRRSEITLELESPAELSVVEADFELRANCSENGGVLDLEVFVQDDPLPFYSRALSCRSGRVEHRLEDLLPDDIEARVKVSHYANSDDLISGEAVSIERNIYTAPVPEYHLSITSPPEGSFLGLDSKIHVECTPGTPFSYSSLGLVDIIFTDSADYSGGEHICPASGQFYFGFRIVGSWGRVDVRTEFAVTITLENGLKASRTYKFSDCMGAIPANADYQPDEFGEFCLVENQNESKLPGMHEFFITANQPISVPDPSISKIGDYYYLVGTADSLHTGDFIIYRSKNLLTWEVHSKAFGSVSSPLPPPYDLSPIRESVGSPSDPSAILPLPNRKNLPGGIEYMCRLWDGQLFVKNDRVYLIFTATVDRTPGQEICRHTSDEVNQNLRNYRSLNSQSVFLASVSVEDFAARVPFASAAHGAGNEPIWFASHYDTTQNTFVYDGAVSRGRLLPNSTPFAGLAPNLKKYGETLCHIPGGCASSLYHAAVVFHDPATGKDQLLYNWRVTLLPSHPHFNTLGRIWNGNHIAGVTLSPALYLPDLNSNIKNYAANKSDLTFVPQSDVNLPPEQRRVIAEGCGDAAIEGTYCVAEGPSVLLAPETGRYYLSYTRGGDYLSSSYSMFYRSANTFEELGSTQFSSNPSGERRLLEAAERDVRPADSTPVSGELDRAGPVYGAGEFFTVEDSDGNFRSYLVFSRKVDNRDEDSPGIPHRYVQIKELSFDSEGEILSLVEGHPDPRRNPDVLLVPR